MAKVTGAADYRGRHRPGHGPATPADELPLDQVLVGRYRLVERLSPPQPVLFRAADLLLRRDVVITFAMLDSDSAELIYGSDDAPGISRLRVPALATLLDVGHDPEVRESFVVSEHLSDTAVSDVLESGELTLDELQPMLRQLAELILALVRSGFGHRRLAPEQLRVGRSVDGYGTRIQAGLLGLYPLPRENGRPVPADLADEVRALASIAQAAADAAEAARKLAADATTPEVAARSDVAWAALLAGLVALREDAEETIQVAETALRRYLGLPVAG